MSDSIKLSVGDKAPDFKLFDESGNQRELKDYLGKKLIIFFYPAAMTPGCTKEACDFRDSVEPLRAAGYEIVGISPDKEEKLQKFKERDALSYPLLSDPNKDTLLAYGAFGDKSLYGRITRGVIRSTFIIDEKGLIEEAMYNVKATGHVARILKMLDIAA